MNQRRVIGCAGGIPWHLPDDLKRFAAKTTGHTVLMGRKTYDSLPAKFKPLPNRLNVVATRDENFKPAESVRTCASVLDFVEDVRRGEVQLPSNKLWIIGGEEIYRVTLPYWDEVELTLVEGEHDGDAYFPEFETKFVLESEEQKANYSIKNYRRTVGHEKQARPV